MAIQVSGGISNVQNLQGRLRFFKITAATAVNGFEYTVGTDNGSGEPEVLVPNSSTGSGVGSMATILVGIGMPVPNSLASIILELVQREATVTIIRIVSDTEMHIAIENTDNAWDQTMMTGVEANGMDSDSAAAENAAARMQVAIRALSLGAILAARPIPNTDAAGKVTIDLTGMEVREVPFELK